MDEARLRRGVVASVGVWIVLFNLLAAALLGATAKAQASPPGLDGARIVVCTGFGMVTLDRDEQPIDPVRDQRQSLCPFCLPMVQGPAMVPTPAAALAAPLAGVRVAAKSCLRVPPTPARAVRAAPSRAPPVV